MLRSIVSLLILKVVFSGCTQTNYNKHTELKLPEMPIGGEEVANELANVCNEKKCSNITRWLNELYIFRQQYMIYKAELSKK